MLQAGAGTALPPARRSRTLQQKCTSPRLVILGALIKFVLLPPRLSSAAGHDVAPGVVRESLAIMRVRLNASAAVAGFVPRDPRCLVPVRLIGPGHRALFPAGPESRDRDQCRTSTEGRQEQTIQAGQTRARVGVVQAQKRAGTHPSSVNSRMVANIPLRPPTAHARGENSGADFLFLFSPGMNEARCSEWTSPRRSVGQTRRRHGSYTSATRRCVTVPSTPCARK